MGNKSKQRKTVTPASTSAEAEAPQASQPGTVSGRSSAATPNVSQPPRKDTAETEAPPAAAAPAEAKKIEDAIPVTPPPAAVLDASKAPDPVDEIRNNLKALGGPIATAQASLAAVDPRTSIGKSNLQKLGKIISGGEVSLGRITLPPRETRVLVASAPQACWLSNVKLTCTPASGKVAALSITLGGVAEKRGIFSFTGKPPVIAPGSKLPTEGFARRGEVITVSLRNESTNPVVVEGIAEADFLVDDELWLDLVDKGTALAPLAAVLEKI